MIWLAVFAGYAVVLILAHQLERALCGRWDADRDRLAQRVSREASIAERDVAVRERTVALEEQKLERLTRAMQADPMPPELVERIMTWEDDWAQDQERARIMELYGIYQNWDDVRKHLPALLA